MFLIYNIYGKTTDYTHNCIINYRSSAFAWLIIDIQKSKKKQDRIIELEHQILKVEDSIIELEQNIISKIDDLIKLNKQ